MLPSFDPLKQTYMDYLNATTGFNQQFPLPANNSFPAETNMPSANDPMFQAGQNAGNETLQQWGEKPQAPTAPQAPKPPTGMQAAGNIASGATVAQQAENWARPLLTPASEVSSGVPPVTSQYPLTEAVLQGGDVGTSSTLVNPATAFPGSGAFASYGIPAAITAATIMGAQNAGSSYGAGHEGGVGGGIRSVADSGNDLTTAFATGGLSIPASLAAGVVGGLQSGKGKDQRARDTVRKGAQDSGWVDNNFQVPLPSGNLDLSKDGGFKYQNASGEERAAYNIDWNDPNAPQAVGWIQPLAAVLSKGDSKLTSDFTGQLYNELTKNGGATDLPSIRKRVVELYNQFKLRPSIVAEAVNHMDLEPGRRDAYLAAIDNLKPGREPQTNPGQKPSQVSSAMGTPGNNKPSPGGVPASVVNQVSRGRTMQPMGTGVMKRAA